jgi:hypothetical protein
MKVYFTGALSSTWDRLLSRSLGQSVQQPLSSFLRTLFSAVEKSDRKCYFIIFCASLMSFDSTFSNALMFAAQTY